MANMQSKEVNLTKRVQTSKGLRAMPRGPVPKWAGQTRLVLAG